jgi:hypothetical protein
VIVGTRNRVSDNEGWLINDWDFVGDGFLSSSHTLVNQHVAQV